MLEVDEQNTSLGSEVGGRLWFVAEELVLMVDVEEFEAEVNLPSQSTFSCGLRRRIGHFSGCFPILAGLWLASRS